MAASLTIKRKLTLLAAAAALGPIPIGAAALWQLDSALHTNHQTTIQDVVGTARQVVDDLQDEVARGTLSEAAAQEHAKRYLRKLRYNDHGDYVFVHATDGINVVLGPNPELEGRDLSGLEDPNGVKIVADFIDVARAGGGFVHYHWERHGELLPKISFVELDPEWQWVLGTGVYTDDIAAEVRATALSLGAILLLISTSLATAALLILRSISRPLAEITDVTQRVAAGALDTEIPYADNNDEIGALANALRTFRREARERRGLETKLASSFESEIGTLIERVAGLAGSFESAGASVREAAGTAKDRATAGSSAASQASANVQTVAAASEEMSASIHEITGRVVESRDVVTEAAAASRRAGLTLEELRGRAGEIDSFVELVSGIADQTNLLALNATIEAARAGDAGRGFAVVANEVKTLAGQTNKATADIADRVEALRDASRRTEEELVSVASVIDRLTDIATSIAAAMEEQSAATTEIARNVQQAAVGNENVTEVITHVAAAAGASDEAAARIAKTAADLARQASDLRTGVRDFLKGLRAA